MNDKILLSIHRHWTWADRMKELFEYYLSKEGPLTDFTMMDLFLSSLGTCMCMWYSLLYATCEGLQEKGKVNIAGEIDQNYDKVCCELRRFRNATFHVQPQLEPEKLMVVLKNPDIVPIIRTLHERVGAYLVQHIQQLPAYQKGVRESG